MQELWHSYLTHMQERSLVVEGPLTSLKPSLVPLATPERRFDRRAFSLGTRFSNRYVLKSLGMRMTRLLSLHRLYFSADV